MTPSDPLAKRVKRHVIGPVHTFFAATSPHLESLCLHELKNLSLPLESVNAVPGGVEFRGRLQACYAANLLLRIPNRILMRIAEFKVTNFRQLGTIISRFPWELYINAAVKRAFHIKITKSRLYHKAAIAGEFERGICHRLKGVSVEPGRPVDKNVLQRVFIRGMADRFTVSLDTSGDLLFKRGLKKYVGKAPLRETIAAAILNHAGYTGLEPLMDPMCGSGTFSLEAALIAGRIPVGWFRDFMFMSWPAFKPNQWEYLKKINRPHPDQSTGTMVFASDKNLSMCRHLERISKQFGLSDTIRVMHKDFFDGTPADVTPKTGLVVLNPPFGIRMASPRTTTDYYSEIIEKLKKDYQGWRMALLLPKPFFMKGHVNGLNTFPIYHGGLNLSLVVGSVSSQCF